ncbi:DUF4913 domain-containing protein [Nocardia fluminea]|uniref:DUF4913 domain-containing protein n=1 Tax=Nocardia fluminea TaxID=134984 RepID=UPI00365A7357
MTTTENPTEAPATEVPAIAQVAAGALAQVDLTESLNAAVRKAVAVQVAAAAKDIAQGVVEEFLTDPVRNSMRETAILEAEAAVNPDAAAVVEPEPAPEPAPEPEPEAAPQPEPEPELRFRTLDAFVEKYVAHTYRREVTARGSENTLRWCPCWWDHGEATARLDALWMAFEALRQGEGAEMNTWWVQHADPQMAVIFDPEGPFKYCSVAEGHKPKMAVLATVPAPAGWFADGHSHDQAPDAPGAVSGLVIPAPSTSRARVVLTIDEFPG